MESVPKNSVIDMNNLITASTITLVFIPYDTFI